MLVGLKVPILPLISANSSGDADQALFFWLKPRWGGGPVMEAISRESMYVGFGFLVERTGRNETFPPSFEFCPSFVCFGDGRLTGGREEAGKTGSDGTWLAGVACSVELEDSVVAVGLPSLGRCASAAIESGCDSLRSFKCLISNLDSPLLYLPTSILKVDLVNLS